MKLVSCAAWLALTVLSVACTVADKSKYRFEDAPDGGGGFGNQLGGAGMSAAGGSGTGGSGGVGASVAGSSGMSGGSGMSAGGVGAAGAGGAGIGGGSTTGACAPNPCGNGGSCQNMGAGFKCTCPSTFTGTTCQTDVDECTQSAQSPCLNAGTCTNTVGGYTCACGARFTGSTCQFQKFRGIGMLSGDTSSAAAAISADGTTVVGLSRSDANHAVETVNAGPLLYLPTPTSLLDCFAEGVSGDGALVVGVCEDSQSEYPMQYTMGSGLTITPLTPLPAGTALLLSGVSDDAKTMIGYTEDPAEATPIDGVVHTASGFAYVGKLTVNGQNQATAVSADGSTVVGLEDTSAWKWTAAGIQLLPQAATWSSAAASAISSDGKVIVGTAQLTAGGTHAVRWTSAGFVDDGEGGYADVNSDGTVLAGSNAGVPTIWVNNVAQPFLMRLGATTDLTGWTVSAISAISNDGKTVCGNGVHNGVNEGWVAHLP